MYCSVPAETDVRTAGTRQRRRNRPQQPGKAAFPRARAAALRPAISDRPGVQGRAGAGRRARCAASGSAAARSPRRRRAAAARRGAARRPACCPCSAPSRARRSARPLPRCTARALLSGATGLKKQPKRRLRAHLKKRALGQSSRSAAAAPPERRPLPNARESCRASRCCIRRYWPPCGSPASTAGPQCGPRCRPSLQGCCAMLSSGRWTGCPLPSPRREQSSCCGASLGRSRPGAGMGLQNGCTESWLTLSLHKCLHFTRRLAELYA